MKLYSSLTSPFARKVRVALHEMDLMDTVEEIVTDPFASDPPTEFLAANPLSRVPTLITDEGLALPDSKLILDWLQATCKQRLPDDQARWPAARRGVIAEGILEAAVATVLEKRRPEGIIMPAALDRHAAGIHRALDILALEAGVLGDGHQRPTLANLTTGVALAYLDLRLPYLDWRRRAPALEPWFEAFSARPSMIATQPPAA
jgi:glutathione S-transferase